MKKWENIENKLIPLVFLIMLILIWQLVVDRGLIPRFILPSPYDVIKTTITTFGDLKKHILITLLEAGTGFTIAVFLSLFLAVLMDSVDIIKKAIYPLLIISQTVPIIALAPLFVIWFGFGLLPKVIVVVLVCFFPIVVSLLDGLQSVDIDVVNLMKSMGASKIKIFTLVKFPASMISFFSGLRIAATYSIMGAVIGEWLGGENGLGVYMMRVKHSYAMDKVFAVIFIIILLSMTLFKLIDLIQYISMPWNRSHSKI